MMVRRFSGMGTRNHLRMKGAELTKPGIRHECCVMLKKPTEKKSP